MSETFVNINGSVTGDKLVTDMINRAPKLYQNAILGWLLKERNSFVGDKRKDGAFRKKLLRKKTLTGKTWEPKVVRIFKGWINGGHKIGMTLEMGFPTTRKRKIHKIMESLTKRHTITSSKYMPIPVYKNIPGQGSASKLFHRKARAEEFTMIFKGGKILYFDKVGSKELLFVGTKKVKVKKKFDFQKDWNRRIPAVMRRYEKAINRATIKAQKQYG